MVIRESTKQDRTEITSIHDNAFGKDKGKEISDLVNGMLDDKTSEPILSLVAEENGKMIGHILFTKALINQSNNEISAQILAPLAILPDHQNKGIGTELINKGLKQLKDSGVDLVFVLGHPGYYPRWGFSPAGVLGFDAPYPIPEEHAEAWMVQELRDGVIGSVKGKVQCSEVLNQPQHWRE